MPSYSAGSATVQIVPDFSGAQRKIGEWFARQGDAKIGVDPDLNRAGMERAKAEISGHKATIDVDADFHGLETKIAKFLDTATGFSMVEGAFKTLFGPRSILMTNGVGALTALASAASAALPAIGLLPAAIMGAAAPLAALTIGVRGVGEAFKALGAADKAAGADATAAAAARKAAAAQVEAAQKGVESAQRGTEAAARQLEMAQRGVEDALHGVEDANRKVEDAERGVAKAQEATRQAQLDLDAARAAAVRNLQDMNLELARASLNEEGAALSVQQAQLRLQDALGKGDDVARQAAAAAIELQRAQASLAQVMDDPRKSEADRAAAVLAVAEAQDKLNELQTEGAQKHALEVKQADLAYRQAQEALKEIQVQNQRLKADTEAADAAGVEGAANVVAAKAKVVSSVENEAAAQRKLEDAQRGVVDAQRSVADAQRGVADAQRGVTDAATALTEAQTKLAEAQAESATSGSKAASAAAEAMAKLSPAAQAFVTTVRGLKGAWDELAGSVQQSLFSGLAATIQTLADRQLPTLKAGLSGIAAELNGGFRASMAVFSTDGAVKDFAATLENIRVAWHNMAEAAAPLTQVFIDLTTVGSEFLPQLSSGLGGMIGKFAEFIGKLRETGQLHEIFQTALDTLHQLFDIVGNLGGSIGSIFDAALPSGQVIMTLLQTVTQSLQDLLGSTEGQAGLSTFFEGIASTLTALQPAIDALVDAAVTGLLPAIAGLAAALAPVVGDVLTQFAQMVKDLAPIIYPILANAIASLVTALAPLIPIISDVAQQILPILGKAIEQLAPYLSQFFELIGDALVQAIQMLLPLLPTLMDAFFRIVDALMPLVPIILELALTLLPPLVTLLNLLLPPFAGLIEVLAPIVGWLLKLIEPLLKPLLIIIGVLALAVAALVAPWWSLIAVVGLVIGVIKNLWDTNQGFHDAIMAIWGAIQTAWNAVVDAMVWAWDNLLKPAWDAILAAATWVFQTILMPIFDAVLWAWNLLVTGITWYWDNVLSPVFSVIMGIAKVLFRILVVVVFGAIMLAWTALTTGIAWAWENILKPVWAAIQAAAGWLWDNVLKPVFDAIGKGWSLLMDGFDWVWTNILKPVWEAIQAAANWLWDHVLKPVFDAIGKGWSALMDGFGWVYDHVLKPVFDAFGEAAGALKTAFEAVVAGIKKAWDTVMDILSTPINFVIEMIFNRGLFKIWNWAVDSLGLDEDWKAPPFKQLDHGVHFADGGTIPGSSPHSRADNIPIMATAGEFMQPVSAHQMYGTGFMEAVRTGLFPVELARGFADGGPIWKTLDKKRQEWFPGSVRTSDVRPGDPGYHGRGMAIDIGWAGNNQARLDEIGRRLVKLAPGSAEIIHNPTASVKNGKVVPSSLWGAATWRDHLDHVHWAISNLAQLKGVASDGTDMTKEDSGSIFSRLLNSITQPIRDLAAKFGGAAHSFTGLIGEIPKGVLGKMWDGAKEKIGEFFSNLLPWNWGDDDSPDGLKDQAREALKGMGWGGDASWNALNQLVSHESSWNPKAQNGTSTASGLFQMVDGTWRSYRGDSDARHMKDADPGDQITAGLRYIKDRYLTPVGAWDFWSGHKYYDRGGWLAPGLTTVMNATGRPEPVLTAAEHDALLRWRRFEKGGPNAPSTVAGFVNNGTVLTTDLDELARKSRRGTQRALMAAGL